MASPKPSGTGAVVWSWQPAASQADKPMKTHLTLTLTAFPVPFRNPCDRLPVAVRRAMPAHGATSNSGGPVRV
jgi:hypothetical protein